jgi:hypothetical protein
MISHTTRKHCLKVFEKGMLEEVCWPKKGEVTEVVKKNHGEKIYDFYLYSLRNLTVMGL